MTHITYLNYNETLVGRKIDLLLVGGGVLEGNVMKVITKDVSKVLL